MHRSSCCQAALHAVRLLRREYCLEVGPTGCKCGTGIRRGSRDELRGALPGLPGGCGAAMAGGSGGGRQEPWKAHEADARPAVQSSRLAGAARTIAVHRSTFMITSLIHYHEALQGAPNTGYTPRLDRRSCTYQSVSLCRDVYGEAVIGGGAAAMATAVGVASMAASSGAATSIQQFLSGPAPGDSPGRESRRGSPFTCMQLHVTRRSCRHFSKLAQS